MSDFAKHQAELLESQRAFRVNEAPMCMDWPCICDPRPAEDEPSRRSWWPAAMVFIVCAVAVGGVAIWTAARAAEQERPHDLWLVLKPTAIEWAAANEQRNAFQIGSDFRNLDKCEKAKAGMRKVAGSLQCLPSERRE